MVELLVAVTIGMLLMTGAISIFLSNKHTYEITDDLSRLQENARYAIATMAKDIRMVGFFGCADNALALQNGLSGATGGSLHDTGDAVEGFEQGAVVWAPSGSNAGIGSIVANSDAITVRYLEGVGDPLTANMTAQGDALQINATNDLSQGDIVAVSDCSSADILQVSTADPNGGTLAHAAGGTPGNSATTLSKVYQTDATVSRMGAARYYVGSDASGEPSLFRTRLQQDPTDATKRTPVTEQLVDGVESMQILYGVDNVNGDRAPDIYVNAAAVANWANVVTVRIGMLMRTVDQYGGEEDIGNFDNADFDNARFDVAGTVVCMTTDTDATCDQFYENDRRRRRVFETTLAMRNLQ